MTEEEIKEIKKIVKKEIQEAKVVDVATQTAPAIQLGDEYIDQLELLVLIYNKLSKIEKAVA